MENIYGVMIDSVSSLKEKLKKIITSNSEEEIARFISQADDLRKIRFKNKVTLCAIVNAKCGKCTEDCAFCSQSARFDTKIDTYPLISPEEILKKAGEASLNHAGCFSIITSGRGVYDKKEIASIAKALGLLSKKFPHLKRSASLGIISEHTLRILKDAGLQKYHHNLETSKRFFPNISKTHTYEEKVNVILAAKSIGLEVCSGGIFGMGEDWDDRIDLALNLKRLKVDSVPINFLNPIKGTNLESMPHLKPKDAFLIIALFRMLLPDTDIKVCGGRNAVLKDEDDKIFSSGASGMMIGNYLTTAGCDPKRDLDMLKRLSLEPLCP